MEAVSAQSNQAATKKPFLPASLQGMTSKIIILVCLLVLISGAVLLFYLPKQKELQLKQGKLNQIATLSAKVDNLTNELAVQQEALQLAQEQYKENTARAYTQPALDRLLGNISYLGNEYALSIDKIEQLNRTDSSSEKTNTNSNNSSLTEVHIKLQLSGHYLDYMQFRQALLGVSRAIHLQSETINVLPAPSSKIEVTGELIVYLAEEGK